MHGNAVHPRFSIATLWALCGALIGCAPPYSPPPLPLNHPANPAAAEAPLPPGSQTLTREPSRASSREADAVGRGHDHGRMLRSMHGGHE